MKQEYICSFCGKTHVKLWRPIDDFQPLACASCLESMQAPQEYDELVWTKVDNQYWGKPTGKKFLFPKWKIDEDGKIPSYLIPSPDEEPVTNTDLLIVNLGIECIPMIPAIPNTNLGFWPYSSAPQSSYKLWEILPTN